MYFSRITLIYLNNFFALTGMINAVIKVTDTIKFAFIKKI